MAKATQKHVIILEDSSKVSFGGGQRGTLEIIDVLEDQYQIHLFDTTTQSVFYRRAQEKLGIVHLLGGYGKIVGGHEAAFSVGLKEVLLFPYYFATNVAKLFYFLRKNGLNRTNTIFYTSCKKPLIFAAALSYVTKVGYWYHARNYYNRASPFYRFLRLVVRNATGIICVSQTVKDNLNAKRSTVVYNPIRLENTKPPAARSIQDRSPVVVAVFASLLPWKGIQYFMQSFLYLKHQNRVHYRIYGEGSERNNLDLYTNRQVQLLGFTEHTDRLLANEIDLVCVPSVAEEAFGRVSVEGFKYGIPAITTNIGGQKEINLPGKVGFQVPIKDPAAIAARVDYFIDHPNEYEEMSHNALRYVKNFDFQSFRRSILPLFESSFVT
jgi:glycosyltransferase involved in cell wall biosynthesis